MTHPVRWECRCGQFFLAPSDNTWVRCGHCGRDMTTQTPTARAEGAREGLIDQLTEEVSVMMAGWSGSRSDAEDAEIRERLTAVLDRYRLLDPETQVAVDLSEAFGGDRVALRGTVMGEPNEHQTEVGLDGGPCVCVANEVVIFPALHQRVRAGNGKT